MRVPLDFAPAIGLLAFVGVARAQPPPRLAVERAAGAETCPDSGELQALVDGVRGRPAEAGPTYRVRFERDGEGLRALLASDADPGTRALSDAGDTCTALARATAVTLALLFDGDPPPPSVEA